MEYLESYRRGEAAPQAIQPGEWGDLEAALAHLERQIAGRRVEVGQEAERLQQAARRDDLGAVAAILPRRAALDAVIAGLTLMRGEVLARFNKVDTEAKNLESAIIRTCEKEAELVETASARRRRLFGLEQQMKRFEEKEKQAPMGRLTGVDVGEAEQLRRQMAALYRETQATLQRLAGTFEHINSLVGRLESMGYPYELQRAASQAILDAPGVSRFAA